MNTRPILLAAFGALLPAAGLHAADNALLNTGTSGILNAAIGGGRLVSNWTFTAWINLAEAGSYTLPDSPVAVLTSQESPPTGLSAEILLADNGGTQRLEIGRSNSYFGTQSTRAVPLNQWTHIAVTVSSAKVVSYYINGAAAGVFATEYASRDVTLGGTSGAGTGLIRLMGNGAARKFKGRMDDVQIWSTVLSQAQIRGYMTTPPAGNEPALADWFRFDDGAGTIVSNSDTVNSSGPATIVDGSGLGWVPGASVTYTVSTAADSGTGSLRQILTDASAVSGPGTIVFAPALSGQVILLNSEIPVADVSGLIIDATALPGGITIKGGPAGNRLFNSFDGTILIMRGLTLANGKAGDAGGGAIYNKGTLTLTRCLLTGNSAPLYSGGAVYSLGALTLTECTLSGNSSIAGGAVDCESGTALVTHCTLSENTANNFGGAILSSVPVSLTHCTVSGNQADTGGGLSNYLSTLTLTNSIVAGNTGADAKDVYNFQGFFVREGANIVQDFRNALSGADSGPAAINAAPLLAPLADYGGTTPTMALRPGSPARNAAVGSTAATDQRGYPTVGVPDIGAYEAGYFTNCPAYIAESLPATATAAQSAPGADFDFDGATNADEWLALTDPVSPFSVFRVTSTVRSGGNTVLTFPTVTGRKYTLWRSDTLTGAWIDTGLPAITGNGTNQTFTVPATPAGVPRRFYRVETGP